MKTNIYLKVATIVVIALVLLLPAGMIGGLISEREQTQTLAIQSVSEQWAGAQVITGPVLTIPYYKYQREGNGRDSTKRLVRIKEYIHILPNALNVNGTILPEKRTRGIYEIVVYNSKLSLSGSFNALDLAAFDIAPSDLLLDKAELAIGMNDLRGIERQVDVQWNNLSIPFNPGVTSADVIKSGMKALVPVSTTDTSSYAFSLELDLKGSQQLYFTPVGKVTDVTMRSTWNNPSFDGAFLPDTRTVTDSGFTANWNVLHLNRNFPQQWTGSQFAPEMAAFGTNLILPVDSYQKAHRAVRYAILFIAFTFLVFFFMEVMNKLFIHPVQYLLVGVALVVFFTLLLSISEYLSFDLSFIISALATLILVGSYVKAILQSWKLASIVVGILSILYGFIFVIMQLQDLALLIGSIGIFVILSLVMYVSRKIDWYGLSLADKASANEGKK